MASWGTSRGLRPVGQSRWPTSVPAPLRTTAAGTAAQRAFRAAILSCWTALPGQWSRAAASPGCGVRMSPGPRAASRAGSPASSIRASASNTQAGRSGSFSRAARNAWLSFPRPMPGPMTRARHWWRRCRRSSGSWAGQSLFPGSPRGSVMISGQPMRT